jgi:hypothetical protein
MTTTITRLYDSYAQAEDAVNALEAAGVAQNDISVLASNSDNWYDEKKGTFPDRDLDGKDDRVEGAGAGAGIGAVAGGTVGALTGLGLMAIPGVGPIVAAGWLVATLTGAAAGAATGGVVGALTQAGIDNEDAPVYAEALRRGGAVVSAKVADTDAGRLQGILDRQSVRVSDRATAYRNAGWKTFDAGAQPFTADQVRRERDLYR